MKFLIIFLVTCNLCFSQDEIEYDYNNSGALKIRLINNCSEAEDCAKIDIKNNTIYIFLQGGIAPVVYSTDKDFENKYNINFDDLGCIGTKCAETYNHYIFHHLYETFGKKWMKTIRKDAIGFISWKKSKRNKQ